MIRPTSSFHLFSSHVWTWIRGFSHTSWSAIQTGPKQTKLSMQSQAKNLPFWYTFCQINLCICVERFLNSIFKSCCHWFQCEVYFSKMDYQTLKYMFSICLYLVYVYHVLLLAMYFHGIVEVFISKEFKRLTIYVKYEYGLRMAWWWMSFRLIIVIASCINYVDVVWVWLDSV